MAKADECLFLLEVLIDKTIFIKSPCFSDKNFKTCVSFEFLSLAPLVICDDDAACSGSSGGPYVKDFNSGKSCLFALKQPDIDKAMQGFPMNVTVYKSLPCDCLPTKVIMGTCTIDVTREFAEARKKYLADPDSVSSESKKDAFRLIAADKSDTGDLLLFLRISCFGKIIITKFQGTDGATKPFCDGGGKSKACSPKKEFRNVDDPCACGAGSRGGKGGGGCSSGGISIAEATTPCQDPEDPCCCSGPPQSGAARSPVACRNTEAYCLHVPKGGGGPVHFEEMGTSINGNDLKIKVPKDACVIKKISETHTSMQRPFGGKTGNCESPCAKNQISLNLPINQGCCGGLKPQVTNFTCTTEGCSSVGKHGTAGCNMVPSNVPGAAATTGKIHPNKDVFVLRVAKTASDGDRRTKLELELVTPKGPDKKLPVRMETREAQCEEESDNSKKKQKACGKKKGKCEF